MKNKFFYLFLKRAFDFVAALAGFIILLPVFLFFAIWIKLDSKGPIFYLQERIGQFGKPFKIWKFRTMVSDADKKGPLITLDRDPRITQAGNFLRHYKLDELPQLINVILGNMSLVGPRPEVKKYVDLYSSEQRKVLDFKPGITDPASIKYRKEQELLMKADDIETVYVKTIMPDKININIEYMSKASLAQDLKFIFLTIYKIAE